MDGLPHHIKPRPAETSRRLPYIDGSQNYWWGSLPRSGELLGHIGKEGLYRLERPRAGWEALGFMDRFRFYRGRPCPAPRERPHLLKQRLFGPGG
jgi:hypothetical protein